MLTNFNGQTITYDEIGNPLQYRDGMSFTWAKGRQLQGITKDGLNASYTYDENGLRISKTVNGVTTKIFRTNGQPVGMNSSDGKDVTFILDGDGKVYGVHYDHYSFDQLSSATYYFAFNAQGDVIGIYDFGGRLMATYDYDEWGNCTVNVLAADSNGHAIDSPDHVAQVNPFRYRGYFYDAETGFYYVSSRYYDPEIGRWINADNQIAGVGGEVLGYNMFAYCMNNPVNMSDPTGNWPSWSNLLKGSAWLAVGITAVCVGVSVLTCGVAAPAMVAVAAVTVGAGALTAVNGAAEIGEAFTGYNVVRDTVFSGNQKAYDAYANTTAAVAEVGTAVCGGWLKSPSTQTKIADKTLQNVIDNPNSVTKLSTDKFHKIANKSSWEFKPTQNNKGYRALKGDMSIRYNMNGTRFDAAHFGGSPYWVISSAKNGTIKIMMP